MGQNLARNVASKGFPIAVHNRTSAKTEEFVATYGHEGDIVGGATMADFVGALERPRAVMIMVKAGAPVDAVIEELIAHLDDGDVIIDGGNSLFTDTERRVRSLAARGLRFLGTGVSGGEEGALHGPSMMPGGSHDAYAVVAEVFTKIAAQVDGEPCCTYIGDGGAGHYTKMVHNGIEYADMQLIAEAYDLLRHGLGLGNDELHEVFSTWNAGELSSFLIEITARIFAVRDDQPPVAGVAGAPGHLIDQVLDQAAQKGTGRQTAQEALELGIPVTAITEAVFARALSALRDQRLAASTVLPGPVPGDARVGDDRQGFVDAVRDALYASKVVAYAQGFDQLRAAGAEHGWALDLGTTAAIWRGGCIIRAQFLNRIRDAYTEHPDLANLLLAPYFTELLARTQDNWRRVVSEAVRLGIPAPAFSSSLAYYDGYRRAQLPANLIQAQRDLFGAHTYERVDRPGTFHSAWE